MKTLTVPKLELQAALLAARLSSEVHQALTRHLEKTYLWTDSTTVLQWSNSLEKQPIFIANRVSEILDLTTVDQWNYIGTSDNPADAGTRRLSAEALKVSSWFTGPEFLRTPDFPFQVDDTVSQSIKKKKVDQQLFVSVASNQQRTQVVFDWTKYSSFSKIVRIAAYILRLLPRHRHFRSRDLKITDSVELSLAEEKVLLLSQRESFRDELKCLSKENSIANTSRIRSFSPFFGPGGLLKSTGRTKRLDWIEFDTKHPIILDGLHPVVPLMLENLHKCHHHQGLDFMRSQVQQRFAVLRLRQMLRKVENECLVCRKRKAQTLTPMMADLPKEVGISVSTIHHDRRRLLRSLFRQSSTFI